MPGPEIASPGSCVGCIGGRKTLLRKSIFAPSPWPWTDHPNLLGGTWNPSLFNRALVILGDPQGSLRSPVCRVCYT
jgi:hypothetical protein